jgi:endonuclease YncB( thermonuclease family)
MAGGRKCVYAPSFPIAGFVAGDGMREMFLLILFAIAPAVYADFTGRVVKVSDGDTLTVLVAKRQVRVRLEGT